jgi:hypothetical protein
MHWLFTQAQRFIQKPILMLFSGQEVPNLVDPLKSSYSVAGCHTKCDLLGYAPDNRSCLMVITGKWQLKIKN